MHEQEIQELNDQIALLKNTSNLKIKEKETAN